LDWWIRSDFNCRQNRKPPQVKTYPRPA